MRGFEEPLSALHADTKEILFSKSVRLIRANNNLAEMSRIPRGGKTFLFPTFVKCTRRTPLAIVACPTPFFSPFEAREMRAAVREALRGDDIFATFVVNVARRRATTVSAVRSAAKDTGDVWEEFCCEFLRLRGYESALLLRDVPDDELVRLGLRRKDMGIDIVARLDGRHVAVQCKFRRRGSVGWSQLATFEALCARTGPWHKHLVMTNQPFVRREGRRSSKDWTIARQSFAAISRDEWNLLAGYGSGRVLGVGDSQPTREAWLARLERTTS